MALAGTDVRGLFLAALERPQGERAAYLDEACAGKAALRQRVEALLRAHDEPGAFLGEGKPDPNATTSLAPPSPLVGTVIAERYKLLEEIGDGGMGTVWMAEQREPVKRLVAVKLIKAGMDSKTVLARFEAERQALALMDHPNIAKVLDGGTTDDGHPFFVMELVKGLPLTEYCDARKLSVNDRLDLFVQICSAVQHAHQKAVIHRDLKPSNVLVTEHDGKPVPKVIDFGLAKALNSSNMLTERTLHTAYGTVVGTPLYMAPEQVGINALDVDTRTDVYALGVILYELLTGSTPLEKARFKEAAWEEVKRLIREEEPPRPSTRLSSDKTLPSLAASRQVDAAKLPGLVRGELDWIVMKALDKDRSRRYETANGLSKDVQRYLKGDAVEACPPTLGYRLQKVYRKNRAAVLTAGAFAVILLVGLVATSIGFERATRERERATAAEQNAVENALKAMDSAEEAQRERDEANEQRLRAEGNFQKALAAVDRMLLHLGDERLANVPQVTPVRRAVLEDALKLFQEILNQDGQNPAVRGETARAYQRVGIINRELGRVNPSEQALLRSIAMLEKLTAEFPDDLTYRSELGRSYFHLGRLFWRPMLLSSPDQGGTLREGERAFRKALPIWERLVADAPDETEHRRYLAWSLNSLGLLLKDAKRYEEAGDWFRKAIDHRRRLAGEFPDQPVFRSDLAGSLHNHAMVLRELGDRDVAERQFRAAVALQEPLVEQFPTHSQYRDFLSYHYANIASIRHAAGDAKSAEEFGRKVTAHRERLVADYPTVPVHRADLAWNYAFLARVVKSRDLAEFEKCWRRSLDLWKGLAADFPDAAGYRTNLAQGCLSFGNQPMSRPDRLAEAEAAFRECVEQYRQLGDRFPDVPLHRSGIGYGELARCLQAQGRLADAEQAFRDGNLRDESVEDSQPARRDALISNYQQLGRLLGSRGEWSEAGRAFSRSFAIAETPIARSNSPSWPCRSCLRPQSSGKHSERPGTEPSGSRKRSKLCRKPTLLATTPSASMPRCFWRWPTGGSISRNPLESGLRKRRCMSNGSTHSTTMNSHSCLAKRNSYWGSLVMRNPL
jgi:tetratricopeptide (TPR) repeat protein